MNYQPTKLLGNRASLRRTGQVKGKDNPLLGAAHSRSGKTGQTLRPLIPFSKMSTKEKKAFKKEVRKLAEQNGATET